MGGRENRPKAEGKKDTPCLGNIHIMRSVRRGDPCDRPIDDVIQDEYKIRPYRDAPDRKIQRTRPAPTK